MLSYNLLQNGSVAYNDNGLNSLYQESFMGRHAENIRVANMCYVCSSLVVV